MTMKWPQLLLSAGMCASFFFLGNRKKATDYSNNAFGIISKQPVVHGDLLYQSKSNECATSDPMRAFLLNPFQFNITYPKGRKTTKGACKQKNPKNSLPTENQTNIQDLIGTWITGRPVAY